MYFQKFHKLFLNNPMAQGHLARKRFARKIFKMDLWSLGASFFPIGTIN